MSGRPKKEEEKGILGSLAGGLLLAGGAAAVGYLAYKMFDDDNSNCSVQSPSSSSRPMNSSSPNNVNNVTSRMKSRKQEAKSVNKDEIPSGTKCVICFENEREVLFEPCNHACACEDCAAKIGPCCPICRNRIVSKKAIYL